MPPPDTDISTTAKLDALLIAGLIARQNHKIANHHRIQCDFRNRNLGVDELICLIFTTLTPYTPYALHSRRA
jgi:hypothetical protein